MILQVLADTRQFVLQSHPGPGEYRRRTDTGALQDGGGTDGTSTEDDLTAGLGSCHITPVPVPHARHPLSR